MKGTIAILLVSLSSVSAFAAQQETCASIDNKGVEQLFERWNNSLKTGDAKQVAANYLADAVLLPTVSNKVRLTDAERIDYFKHFLEKGPSGNVQSRTIRLGCNIAIDSGIYNFVFADNSSLLARYTFTWQWQGKQWKISTHHSSLMPQA